MLSPNRWIAFFVMALVVSLAAGCAYPTSTLRQGGQRPAIGFKGAPANAKVVVDGIIMGKAGEYDGVHHVLIIEPGSHQISLRQDGSVIFQQQIYVSTGETKVLTVGGYTN